MVKGERLDVDVEGGDEWLVVEINVGEDVGDYLFITERIPNACKFIRKGPHAREVGGCGLSPLLGRCW